MRLCSIWLPTRPLISAQRSGKIRSASLPQTSAERYFFSHFRYCGNECISST